MGALKRMTGALAHFSYQIITIANIKIRNNFFNVVIIFEFTGFRAWYQRVKSFSLSPMLRLNKLAYQASPVSTSVYSQNLISS
jgi:hypothetical protein